MTNIRVTSGEDRVLRGVSQRALLAAEAPGRFELPNRGLAVLSHPSWLIANLHTLPPFLSITAYRLVLVCAGLHPFRTKASHTLPKLSRNPIGARPEVNVSGHMVGPSCNI